MHTAQDIIDLTREWIGTPYRNQGRTKQVETDCVGMFIGVGEQLGYDTSNEPKGYGTTPNPKRMLARIREHFEFVSHSLQDARPGDLLMITWREQPGGQPHHAALLAEWNGRPTIIHAHSIAGGVVEHGFTKDWQDRVRSVWRAKYQKG